VSNAEKHKQVTISNVKKIVMFPSEFSENVELKSAVINNKTADIKII